MKWKHQKVEGSASSKERIRWHVEEQWLLEGGMEVTLWVCISSGKKSSTAAWRRVTLAPEVLADALVEAALAECDDKVEQGDVAGIQQIMDLLETL